MNCLRFLLPAAMTSVLVACGGGGGGSASPSPNSPANSAPVISKTAFNAVEDTDLSIALSATDAQGQSVKFSLVTAPAQGAVTGFSNAGQFVYRGAPDFNGSDTLVVRATDSAGAQSTATLTITVAPQDDAPTIVEDVVTASGITPLIDVLANDREPDGETLTLTLVGSPDFGAAAVENGKIRLTLPAGFQGFNTFSYRAVDAAGAGATVRAVVFIDAAPVRFLYVTNEVAANARNLYSDDLLTRKQLTSFDGTGPTRLGSFTYTSENGRTVLYQEIDRTVAGGALQFLTAVPADGSGGSKRINPPLAANQALVLESNVSPDGRWAAYRIRDVVTEVDRYYLADLTSTAAPREIMLPANASAYSSSGQGAVFDGQSQYLFLGVQIPVPPSDYGMTIYRVSVSNPGAPEQFFSQAVASGLAFTVSVSPDGSRAVIHTGDSVGSQLWLASVTQPTAPLAISPLTTRDVTTIGSQRVDWQKNSVLFNIDSAQLVVPFTSTLHQTDLATGTWTSLGNLPADWSPILIDTHPTAAKALFLSRVTDEGTGGGETIQEVDLVTGAPTRVLEVSNLGGKTAQYVNDGTAVLYGTGNIIAAIPLDDPAHPKSLFDQEYVIGHRFSTDGKILSAGTGPEPVGLSDSVWAINQTTASGTYARKLVQVSQPSDSYAAPIQVIPRY